MKGVIGAI